jgi:hypothetical protein
MMRDFDNESLTVMFRGMKGVVIKTTPFILKKPSFQALFLPSCFAYHLRFGQLHTLWFYERRNGGYFPWSQATARSVGGNECQKLTLCAVSIGQT